MIRIDQMYFSPVKSLALTKLERAKLDKPGIAGDRAFYMIDSAGKLFTQRVYGPLVQIRPEYEVESGRLALSFPDGSVASGIPEPAEAVETAFFGRDVAGHVVKGEWGEALSQFASQEVRLVKADTPGTSFDGFPLSMCSLASLDALAQAAGEEGVDGRRFRQNIYIEGSASHEEDTWIGGEVQVGAARLRVKMADSRCVVTTRSPETGEVDLDTLKLIPSYRTDQPKQVNFGVYCTVAEPGEAAIGDEVQPVRE
jgi:uncharacterized protein YcbX